MSRAHKHTSLPPPYLKRVWVDEAKVPDRALYPFCLPLFRDPGFELALGRRVAMSSPAGTVKPNSGERPAA